MNILLVIPALSIGGAEVTVVNLANNLSDLGHNVFVFECYDKRNADLVNAIDSKVKVVSYFKLGFVTNLLNRFSNVVFKSFVQKDKIYNTLQARHFRSVIKNKKIDIINSHLPSADYFVYMTLGETKLSSLKWVVSMHGSYENNTGVHHLSTVIFKFVKGIIYLTENNLKIIKDQPENVNSKLKLKKIYNCLGDWQFNKEKEVYPIDLESDVFTFGLISRGDYRKGWVEAIEAIIKLNQNGRTCRLIIAGDGPDRVRIENDYKDYPFIIFLGFVNNPIQLVSFFDVGLLPSYFESLPYTIIEYLKARKPVVATRVGEIERMIISPGYSCGQLISTTEKGINTEELYSAMLAYNESKELYDIHKKNTEINYLKFEPENWGKQVISFYSTL